MALIWEGGEYEDEVVMGGLNCTGCPIPSTHDRLLECHYWWHEIASTYHEPNQLRWALSAYITAARSTSLMLQAEKHGFYSTSFYDTWVEYIGALPIMNWINAARVHSYHKRALALRSQVAIYCVLDDEVIADLEEHQYASLYLSPRCTHDVIAQHSCPVPSKDLQGHSHEFDRAWNVPQISFEDALSIPGHGMELLVACAEVIRLLEALVREAHGEAYGHLTLLGWGDLDMVEPTAACMLDTWRWRAGVFHFDGEELSFVHHSQQRIPTDTCMFTRVHGVQG